VLLVDLTQLAADGLVSGILLRIFGGEVFFLCCLSAYVVAAVVFVDVACEVNLK
jgi:hypothetical protein